MDNITGGNRRKVQVRNVRKGGFTDRKKQIFLDHLAGCCNITRAAAAAGVTTETVNYHRRKDPVFAEQVLQALEAGYGALEASLIERAALGGDYEPGAEPVPGPEVVDTDLGVRLLQMRHRLPGPRTGNGSHRPQRVSEAELNKAILAKLDVLATRRKMARAKKKGVRRDAASAGSTARQDELKQ